MSALCPPIPRSKTLSRVRKAGFTLVEMLVVLAIIGLVLGFVVPAITSSLSGYKLGAASEDIIAQLNLARQTALSANHPVQVRFYYQLSGAIGATKTWIGLQSFLQGDTATTALGKPYYFPSQIAVIDNTTQINGADPSSLLDKSFIGIFDVTTGDTTHPLPPPYGITPYTYFLFRSDGRVDPTTNEAVGSAASSAPTSGATAWTNAWLTLKISTAATQANGLPANYVTIQVNALTGSIRPYRP